MMELGNILFGNSRGEVPVKRDDVWTDLLFELLRAYSSDNDDYHMVAFENEVFTVRPYWWGDCTCSIEKEVEAWHKAHPHADLCPVEIRHRKPVNIFKSSKTVAPGVVVSEVDVQRLFSPPQCDCGVWEAFRKWDEERGERAHDKDCKLVLPNFHFKPTDYRMAWYKYPLRDSYASREMSTAEFKLMIDACIASVVSTGA